MKCGVKPLGEGNGGENGSNGDDFSRDAGVRLRRVRGGVPGVDLPEIFRAQDETALRLRGVAGGYAALRRAGTSGFGRETLSSGNGRRSRFAASLFRIGRVGENDEPSGRASVETASFGQDSENGERRNRRKRARRTLGVALAQAGGFVRRDVGDDDARRLRPLRRRVAERRVDVFCSVNDYLDGARAWALLADAALQYSSVGAAFHSASVAAVRDVGRVDPNERAGSERESVVRRRRFRPVGGTRGDACFFDGRIGELDDGAGSDGGNVGFRRTAFVSLGFPSFFRPFGSDADVDAAPDGRRRLGRAFFDDVEFGAAWAARRRARVLRVVASPRRLFFDRVFRRGDGGGFRFRTLELVRSALFDRAFRRRAPADRRRFNAAGPVANGDRLGDALVRRNRFYAESDRRRKRFERTGSPRFFPTRRAARQRKRRIFRGDAEFSRQKGGTSEKLERF